MSFAKPPTHDKTSLSMTISLFVVLITWCNHLTKTNYIKKILISHGMLEEGI